MGVKKILLRFPVFLLLAVFLAPLGAKPALDAEVIPRKYRRSDRGFVGISLPDIGNRDWSFGGTYLRRTLEARGFRVSLQYAGGDNPTQIAHLKAFIDAGADTLIIAPVDPHGLSAVIERAASRAVRIISYGRLIQDSPYLTIFVGFDSYHAGILQGEILENALGLDRGAVGPFNMEFLTGFPQNADGEAQYGGALSQLAPHFTAGRLRIPSNRSGYPVFAANGNPGDARGNRETARRLMAAILADNYGDEKPLHAVIAPTDEMALGVIDALKDAGYTGNRRTRKPMPAVIGMGCDAPNITALRNGEQLASVFRDPRVLADSAAAVTDALALGVSAPVNVGITYNNGGALVPVYICPPLLVYKDNIQSLLIDTGYYDDWELSPDPPSRR